MNRQKVQGIRNAPHKKDLYQTCIEGMPRMEPETFARAYCQRCRNTECTRAQFGNPWIKRMNDQVDYLLNDPTFSNLQTDDHQALARMLFEDRLKHAERMEVARSRQDWEVPEKTPRPSFFLGDPEPEPEPEPEPSAPAPAPAPTPSQTPPVTSPPATRAEPQPSNLMPANTPMPANGVMIDGGPIPTPSQEDDPWTPKKNETVVTPGAKITLR